MTTLDHVDLCTLDSSMKAELLKELLISQGIDAALRYGSGADPLGVIAETTGANVVTVPRNSLAAAHLVLKEAHGDGRVLREWIRLNPDAVPPER
ncbi:MAG TPA: hypothetical protein PKA37_09960 [Planctomycetota bacterium]|nr:hypothetical protein [Planctomycetota bacterium]